MDEFTKKLRWQARSYLEEKAAEPRSRGLADVFCFAAEGDAAETIIEMSKATANTLVVMSPHSGSVLKALAPRKRD